MTPSGPPSAAAECDFLVVGGGIVGLAVAQELRQRYPDRSLTVLERDPEVGTRQTGRNSGVIHAGLYYRPGSLKARLCVAGARRMYEYCERKGLPARRNGKLVVALSAAEVPRLDAIEHRARANGVGGVRRLDAAGIREIEPHAAGIAALHSPDTGVVDFRQVARSLAEDVRASGGRVVTGCEVSAVEEGRGGLRVRHAQGETLASFAVFAAGSGADRLAIAAGAGEDPRILPFRGSWRRLAPAHRDLVRGHIYPVPDPRLPFLGIHFSRGVDGDVLVGPTALLVAGRDDGLSTAGRLADLRTTLGWPGTWRLARQWWRTGAREIHHAVDQRALLAEARRYLPELRAEHLEPGPAGIRAQAVGRDGALIDDFVVSETPRALHVRNAPSPAATASLALAEHIADRVAARLDWRTAKRPGADA